MGNMQDSGFVDDGSRSPGTNNSGHSMLVDRDLKYLQGVASNFASGPQDSEDDHVQTFSSCVQKTENCFKKILTEKKCSAEKLRVVEKTNEQLVQENVQLSSELEKFKQILKERDEPKKIVPNVDPQHRLEKSNFAKMCCLLIEICRDVLWQLFTMKVHPANIIGIIEVILQTEKNNKSLCNMMKKLQEEFKQSTTDHHPKNTDFDISSLYAIIKNGCQRLLNSNYGQYIEIIRLKRNIIAHATSASLPQETFEQEMCEIKEVVLKIEENLPADSRTFSERISLLETSELTEEEEHDAILDFIYVCRVAKATGDDDEMLRKIDELERQELQDELERIRNEKNVFKQKCEYLEDHNLCLQTELLGSQNELRVTTHLNEQLNMTVEDLNKGIEIKNSEIHYLLAENDGFRTGLSTKDKRIEDQDLEIDILTAKVSSHNDELQDVMTDKEKYECLLKDEHEKVDQLRCELQTLKNRIVEKDDKIINLTQDLQSKTDEVLHWQDTAQKGVEKIEDLEQKLQSHENDIIEIQQKSDQLIEELQKSGLESVVTVDKLKEEMKEIERQNLVKVGKLEEDLKQMEGQMSDKQAEVRRAHNKVTDKEAENALLKAQCSELEKEVESKNCTLKKMSEEVKVISGKFSSTDIRVQSLLDEAEHLRVQLLSKTEQLDTVTSNYQQIKSDLKSKEKENETLKGELQKMEKEKKEKNCLLTENQKAIAQLKSDLGKHANKINILQQSITEGQQVIQDRDSTINRQNQEIEELKRELRANEELEIIGKDELQSPQYFIGLYTETFYKRWRAAFYDLSKEKDEVTVVQRLLDILQGKVVECRTNSSAVQRYICSCSEIRKLMMAQSSPMVFGGAAVCGDRMAPEYFDIDSTEDSFSEAHRNTNCIPTVKNTLWLPVNLYHGGPVICKGVVSVYDGKEQQIQCRSKNSPLCSVTPDREREIEQEQSVKLKSSKLFTSQSGKTMKSINGILYQRDGNNWTPVFKK